MPCLPTLLCWPPVHGHPPPLQIFGSDDIKKAIACLLFGGARKRMPDGTYRRGDINVLLLGDPSTAKSQFLKFTSKTAPIAVYTSGKGSSAAGLTASVIRCDGGEVWEGVGGPRQQTSTAGPARQQQAGERCCSQQQQE